MYNGIGLTTPRGSGTNGYIQRNMCFVHKNKEKINYRSEDDLKKLDAMANKKPNEDILAHEKKRVIELKCFEMQELMEDQGYSEDEINSKVKIFRQMLLDEGIKRDVSKNQFGRLNVKESHQMAEANQEKNMKLKEALGISQYFVEGSSLDPERKAKEAAAAAAADTQKKYLLIPDSSDSSPSREPDKTERKRKLSSASEKTEVSLPGKKKKTSKRHKKDRSESPEIKKKKKKKRSEKEKWKYKSKTENSHKRKHYNRSKSSSSRSSSSSSSSHSSKSSSNTTSSSGSRSSSIVSVDFGDEMKSYKKLKQRKKLAVKNVEDKSHKKGKNSRKSQSPGTVRHEDHRSRRDIYEALKKSKHKRSEKRRTSPSSGSSSESNSSPEQYYRLEPVLVKQKSKHRRDKHIIEVVKRKKAISPSNDYKALDKYVGKRKKTYRTTSSSSEEEEDARKHHDKKKKQSVSPHIRRREHHSSEKRKLWSNQDSVPQHKIHENVKSSKKRYKKSGGCSDDEDALKNIYSREKDRPRVSRSRSLSYSPEKNRHNRGTLNLQKNYLNSPEKHNSEEKSDRHRTSAVREKQAVLLSSKDNESFGKFKKSYPEEIHRDNLRSHYQDSSNAPSDIVQVGIRSRSPVKHNGFHKTQSSRLSVSRSPLRSKSGKNHRSRSRSASKSDVSVKVKQKPGNASPKKHSRKSPSFSPPRSKISARIFDSSLSQNSRIMKGEQRKQRSRSKSKNSDRGHSFDRGHGKDYRMHRCQDNREKRSPVVKKNSYQVRRSRSRSKSSSHSKSSIKSKNSLSQQRQANHRKIQDDNPVQGFSTKDKDLQKREEMKNRSRQSRSKSGNRNSAVSVSEIEKDVTRRSKSRSQSPHCLNNKSKVRCNIREEIAKSRNRSHSGSSENTKLLRSNLKNDRRSRSKSLSPSRNKSLKKNKDCLSCSRSVSGSRSRSPVEPMNGKKKNSRSRSISGDRNSKSSKNDNKSRNQESNSKSVSRSPLIEKIPRQDKDISYSKHTKQNEVYCSPTANNNKHYSDESKSRSRSKDRSPAHSDESSRKRINDSRSPSRSPSEHPKSKSRSLSPVHSKFSRQRSHSRSVTPVHSKGHSHSSSRSKSFSRSRSTSSFKSRSKSYSRSRSRSKSYSRSHSRSSSSRSRSRSRSHSKSGARSPSIPRRRGSPSFLDKRRITS